MAVLKLINTRAGLCKFLCLFVMAFLFAALPVWKGETADANGPTLSQEERTFAAKYLKETRQEFLDEISGLSEAQMRYKPNADTWSVAEIAEHIVIVEDRLFGLITEKILKAPAQPEFKGAKGPRVRDDAVIMAVTNREAKKFKAPEIVQPTGQITAKSDLIGNFEKLRARTLSYVEMTKEDMRGHFADNPVMGVIDAYQWMLFMGAHSERHTAQIRELKSNSMFPKK